MRKRKYTNLSLLWANYSKDRAQAIDVMADYTELPYEAVDKAFPKGSDEQFNTVQNDCIRNHVATGLGGMVMLGSLASIPAAKMKICESVEQPQTGIPHCRPLVDISPEFLGASVILGGVVMLGGAYSYIKLKQRVWDAGKSALTGPSAG
jgi:hypothetical protein